jgi:hypothetical protein
MTTTILDRIGVKGEAAAPISRCIPLCQALIHIGVVPFTEASVKEFQKAELTNFKNVRFWGRHPQAAFMASVAVECGYLLCWFATLSLGLVAALRSAFLVEFPLVQGLLILALGATGHLLWSIDEWILEPSGTRWESVDYEAFPGTVPAEVRESARRIQESFPKVRISILYLASDPLMEVEFGDERYCIHQW